MEITKYTSWNKQVINMDKSEQEIKLGVIRRGFLHTYLLQRTKVTFKYKKVKYKKIKTLTLIVFTNTFNYSHIQIL